MQSPFPVSMYVTSQGDQCSSLALSAHPCSHHVDTMCPPGADLQVLPGSSAPTQAVMSYGAERGKCSPGADPSAAPLRETLGSAQQWQVFKRRSKI